MKDEILDEHENDTPDNRKIINQIIFITIGTIVLFFLLEEFRILLPENLLDWQGVQIKTVGLIIIGVIVLNTVLIPSRLNKITPKLTEVEVAVYTGIVIFIIEVVFKITQNIILSGNGFDRSFLETLKTAVIISGIGMLFSNIRIHKIRGKKTRIPILILIACWIIGGLILGH